MVETDIQFMTVVEVFFDSFIQKDSIATFLKFGTIPLI